MPRTSWDQTKRRYTEEEKVEAVGLALVVGPMAAADQLEIPRRTVNNWTHRPEYAYMTPESRHKLASLLSYTAEIALREVQRGLLDPKTPLRAKAKTLEILNRQAEFLEMGKAWTNVGKFLEELD